MCKLPYLLENQGVVVKMKDIEIYSIFLTRKVTECYSTLWWSLKSEVLVELSYCMK